MNQRERILAAAVIALVGLWGINHYYRVYAQTLQSRQSDRDTAQANYEDAQHKLRQAQKALRQVEDWQQRALPSNYEKALSLYKAWLLSKAQEAGLTVSNITQVHGNAGSAAYRPIDYHMTATGSLSSVVTMLYEFYRSPQLHQITRMQLTKPPGATNLTITLDVEALSMRGATAIEKLPEGDSKRLKLAKLDDYKKSLGDRDLVSAYTPPRPPTPPRQRRESKPPDKFDESELARFSASTGSDEEKQAWIYVMPTGKTLHLMAGDELKVGALEGKIESVETQFLVFKSGKKRFRVKLGEFLRKGQEIGADGEVKSTSAEAPPRS
jgi:hypothetical protein